MSRTTNMLNAGEGLALDLPAYCEDFAPRPRCLTRSCDMLDGREESLVAADR